MHSSQKRKPMIESIYNAERNSFRISQRSVSFLPVRNATSFSFSTIPPFVTVGNLRLAFLKDRRLPYGNLLSLRKANRRFPTVTKGGIVEKLKEVAFRTGRKDTDRWEIRKEFLSAL